MLVVVKGKMADTIGGKPFLAEPGHALFYPINVWHTERAVGGSPLEIVYWGWAMDREEDGIHQPSMVFDKNGRLAALGSWLRELSKKGPETDQPLKDMLVYAALREFRALLAPSEPAFVLLARQFVEKNLSNDIGPKDMAHAAGLSLGHFSHAFKAILGIPPGEYLRRRRMEHARSLLLSSPLPLKSIAAEVGYADEYVLFKTFKRMMRMTPGQLRKKPR